MKPLRLGTRGSELALTQSGHVADLLRAVGATVELVVIKTRGDELRDLSLQGNLDKGFFTTEIEAALRRGDVDLAVHSLKDLPTAAVDDLVLGAIPPRAPATDVLLAREDALGDGPLGLKPGARIGTSAARRVALLEAAGAVASPLRGNVPTRVAAARDGKLDAVILARAGLARLGLDPSPLLAFDLEPARFVPAPGQGALAVQCRAADAVVRALLVHVHHAETALHVRLERGVLGRLEGGCHAAVGAWVDATSRTLHAGALVDGAWKAVAVPVTPDADAAAVAALDGPGVHIDGPWLRPATRWWP